MDSIECGNCETCPMVLHISAEIEKTQHFANHIIDDAMSPEVDEMAPELLEAVRSFMPGLLEEDGALNVTTPQDFVKIVRQGASEVVNTMDELAERKQAEVDVLVRKCEGPLKMRASKAGRQITVLLCNSPSLPNGEDCETTHTTRKTI